MVSAYRQQRQVLRPAVGEYRDSGGAAANIDDDRAGEGVLWREHAEGRYERLYNQAVHFEPSLIHAVIYVLNGRGRNDYRLYLNIKTHGIHTEGVVDADIAVQRIFDRYRMKDTLVRRHNDIGLGGVDDAFYIEAHNGARRASQGDHSL